MNSDPDPASPGAASVAETVAYQDTVPSGAPRRGFQPGLLPVAEQTLGHPPPAGPFGGEMVDAALVRQEIARVELHAESQLAYERASFVHEEARQRAAFEAQVEAPAASLVHTWRCCQGCLFRGP